MTEKNLEYAMFSRAEMERRHARARELMGERNIDALLITGEHNFQYFAGTSASIGPGESFARPSIFILPMDGEPVIVTQGKERIVLGCYVRDIRGYYNVLDFPLEVVADALKETGLKNRRVGAELGQEQRMGMPVGAYLESRTPIGPSRRRDALRFSSPTGPDAAVHRAAPERVNHTIRTQAALASARDRPVDGLCDERSRSSS